MRLVINTLITAVVITAVAELGKRSSVFAAVLASLPLTSILAILWLYHDTKDVEKISRLSTGILWAILPSVVFFLALPLLLKQGVRFSGALLLSCGIMVASYWAYVQVLSKFGVNL